MTDKLTPAHLTAGEMWRAFAEYACLAGVDPQVRQCYLDRAKLSDEEAARREAEQPCDRPGECEVGGCLKPALCQAAAVEDKPALAADDLREHADNFRRGGQSNEHIAAILDQAADRIEAHARKISEVRAARDRNIERADAFRTERDTLKARVAELERNQNIFQDAAGKAAVRAEMLEDSLGKAEAKAARLVIQMERAKIMIGARLDAMGPALREAEVNAAWHVLNAALAEADHAGK